MREIVLVARKEFKTAFRQKHFLVLSGLAGALLVLAALVGFRHFTTEYTERRQAQTEKREQWLNQGEKHPHIAAHYGSFAFKPKSLLSFLDFGIDTYAGTTVYLEAHKQHDVTFKPGQHFSSSIRFGEITVAQVLQVLMPLLIIFLCFASIAQEKEQGTLKLLLCQQLRLSQLIWGKIVGLYGLLLLLIVPGIVALIFFILKSPGLHDLAVPRFLWLLLAYAIYLFLFTALSVWVSAVSRTSRNALLALLLIWIVTCVVIPKATANIADDLYPLPSSFAFKNAIDAQIKNGIDGHNPQDERSAAFIEKLLAQYKVDTVTKLPVNLDGLLMYEGEEYSSKVYDAHFRELQETIQRQNKLSSFVSLINPYLAIRNLSMGLAGSDYTTQVNFQRSAEQYRRYFVQAMNKDMAYNSAYGVFEGYAANRTLWEKIKDFDFQIPGLRQVSRLYSWEIAALGFWVLLLYLLITYSAPRIKIV